MNDQNASRVYGARVGLIAGLFSILQVALSTAASHGSEATVRAIQQVFSILANNGIADPTVLIPALLPMLLVTYLSMAGAGLLTILFAGRAGRLAALARGRHVGGASAGMWAWLVATGIWLLASILGVLITHSDGTLSGVVTGTYTSEFLAQELFFLLIQEIIAALLALGFCALAGSIGSRGGDLVAPQPLAPPMGYPYGGYYSQPAQPYVPYGMPMYPGAYPQAHPGYYQQPYPGAPLDRAPLYQPPQFQQPAAPIAYPPPPSFYVPQQEPTPAPSTEPGAAPQAE